MHFYVTKNAYRILLPHYQSAMQHIFANVRPPNLRRDGENLLRTDKFQKKIKQTCTNVNNNYKKKETGRYSLHTMQNVKPISLVVSFNMETL